MKDNVIITPTDLSTFSYCQAKWELEKKYKNISPQKVKETLISLRAKKILTETEKSQLEFMERLVKKFKTLSNGENAHSEYSKQIANSEFFMRTGFLGIIIAFLLMVLYLIFIL